MANKLKIINDPVFGFLSIPNELIYDVLQHPYVQRLNRIRQLGLSYLVYPGAMHSRFGHSLGAMHLMQEAVTSLRLKGVEITDYEATAAMIAILLHDIGHGPFSHVLEHTLVDGVTHEDISLLMMERINEDLSHVRRTDVRCTEGAKPLDMAIAIFKNEYPKHFLHQLISSQLDVDRMDYLCRDSFFTGVQEGRVASERLLKMLDVRDDRLVVQVKGIYSVEKFLVARRLMYWQVYLHKTSVAAEQQLIQILSRAKEIAQGSNNSQLFCSPALHFFLYNHVSFSDFAVHSEALDRYALLDDNDVLCAIKAWISSGDKVLSALSESFINRRLFRGELLAEPLTDARKQALNREYAEALHISEEDARYFWSEHISTSNTYSEKADSIDILYNDGTVRDIAEASEILDLAALTRKPIKRYLFKYRNNL